MCSSWDAARANSTRPKPKSAATCRPCRAMSPISPISTGSIRTVKDQKGALDIVVASAGFVERVLTQDATPAHFDKTFGINARGVYFTVQKALPLMRKGGSIVLVSSGLHLKGLPEHGTYAATKAPCVPSRAPGRWN